MNYGRWAKQSSHPSCLNNPYDNQHGMQSYCVRQEDVITVVPCRNILQLILAVYEFEVVKVVGEIKYSPYSNTNPAKNSTGTRSYLPKHGDNPLE